MIRPDDEIHVHLCQDSVDFRKQMRGLSVLVQEELDPFRPFVIGRRNWLFADTPKGATASARLYSLVEKAKANGFEPWAYLATIFEKLPAATSAAEIEALLPGRIEIGDLQTVTRPPHASSG